MRVAALMRVDGRVVLVRHRMGSMTYHLLPGGGVGRLETVSDALVREVREETGLDIMLGDPLFISDTIDPDSDRHVVNLTFAAQIVGGRITESPEDPRVEAVDLVAPEELTALDLRPPLAPFIVEALETPGTARARYLGPIFTHGKTPLA